MLIAAWMSLGHDQMLTFSMAPHSTRPSLSPWAICWIGLTSTNFGLSSRKFNFLSRYSID